MRYKIILFSVLAVILLSFSITCADPLDNWHWRNPLPQGNDLGSITLGNNLFVAVGNSGSIVTSSDGINWSAQPSITDSNLRAVAYGNGTYVAAGDGGEVLTSPTGITWSHHTVNENLSFYNLAYGNGIYVAVVTENGKENRQIYTSVDGKTWDPGFSEDNTWSSQLIHANGVFFFWANNRLLTSVNGLTWKTISLDQHITSIAYGNGLFVALGYNADYTEDVILTSSDGQKWIQRYSAGMTSFGTSVVYGNGTFVASFGYDSLLMTSNNGINWIKKTTAIHPPFYAITFGMGLFINVGQFGAIHTSSDGINWTRRSSEPYDLRGVTYGKGLFVAVGYPGIILTSPDGKEWTKRTTGPSTTLSGIAYGNGIFVAAGGEYDGTKNTQVLLTSSDGVTWTRLTYDKDPGVQLDAISYGNGIFVAVGYQWIATSKDGLSWSFLNAGGSLRSITFENGVFAATGGGSVIATSTDGLSWSFGLIDPEPSWTYYGIAKGNGIFVAVGGTGCYQFGVPCGGETIKTSPDAITWTWQTGVGRSILTGIAFGADIFAAVGNGIIETSQNGITWKKIPGFSPPFNAIAFGNRTFIAVGSQGTIVQSDPVFNRCAASVSSDLDTVHIPVIKHDGSYFWADMVTEPAGDGTLVYRVTDYEAVDPSLYSDCLISTLSSDFSRLHVPSVIYEDNLLWADMDSIASTEGEMRFRVTQFGALGTNVCSAAASENFDTVHIPILSHAGEFFWADLKKTGALDGNFTYSVMQYGKADPAEYEGCQVSSLTDDFTHLTVPEILRAGRILWAELEISMPPGKEINCKISASGEY